MKVADRLFTALAHGDNAHRAWLKQAIDDFFNEEANQTLDIVAWIDWDTLRVVVHPQQPKQPGSWEPLYTWP